MDFNRIEDVFIDQSLNSLFSNSFEIEETEIQGLSLLIYKEYFTNPNLELKEKIKRVIQKHNLEQSLDPSIHLWKGLEEAKIDLDPYKFISENKIKILLKLKTKEPYIQGIELDSDFNYIFIALIPDDCNESFMKELAYSCQNKKDKILSILFSS